MKKRVVLPLSLLAAACLVPTAAADAIAVPGPFGRGSSTAYSAAPWLLVAALVGITLLVLWKLRKKK